MATGQLVRIGLGLENHKFFSFTFATLLFPWVKASSVEFTWKHWITYNGNLMQNNSNVIFGVFFCRNKECGLLLWKSGRYDPCVDSACSDG